MKKLNEKTRTDIKRLARYVVAHCGNDDRKWYEMYSEAAYVAKHNQANGSNWPTLVEAKQIIALEGLMGADADPDEVVYRLFKRELKAARNRWEI